MATSSGRGWTLTYRDGITLVGFGHPFLNRGPKAFCLRRRDPRKCGARFPVQLGFAPAPLGTITKIAAPHRRTVGALPPMVAIRVAVNDRDRAARRDRDQVVLDPQSRTVVPLSAALDAIDRAWIAW